MVSFSGYDPLVANGILPAPVKEIISTDMVLPSQIPYIPNQNVNGKGDAFVPSYPEQKKGFSWGKWILGSMAATAAVLSIKKHGLKGFLSKFKPSNIKTSISQGFEYIKNHLPKIFTKKA